MSKVMGILPDFGLFNDSRSLNMVMLHDPRSKFRTFLFFPNSTFNIRKSYKISGGKASKGISKNLTGRGWTPPPPPPVPLGLIVGMRNHCIGNDSHL